MGKLINLAVYNPAILDDNEFIEGFVARQDLCKRLLNRLKEITPKNLARHLLIIGQRGMGKTSMLRRLALGIEQTPELSAVLIPLTFREEQYNVHNLHVFWCNCLDALGDYLEKSGRRDQAEQLDSEINRLASSGAPEGNAASALFKAQCAKEGKRPLLLLDNIDLIFAGLKEQQQWGLRRILQERGGVMIVGASSGLMEDTIRPEAPFYDFFQVHQLERLSHAELVSCLRQIALKRDEQGKRVLKVLDSDPARIHTLYDLTGGNPRTLVLLYLLLELDSEGDVMDDLERLLDQVTALYKARVEDLAPQTRVVLDAVALAWNPVTVAQVAAETGIESTSISSQFDRLIKMGILEKVSLSRPAPIGYQLGERFFNIWYLMRNASRRIRNRLRWLTEFLRRLYTPQQLSTLADDFIRRSRDNRRCPGVYGLALADALEGSTLRHTMNHHITKLFQEQATALCKQVDTLIDRSDLDQTTLTMAEAKQLVLNCKRDWGNTSAEEFWDLLGGGFFSIKEKQAITSQLGTMTIGQIESFVDSVRKIYEEMKSYTGLADAFESLRKALREGMLESLGDFAHALAAAKEYNSPELPLVMIMLANRKALSLSPAVSIPLIDALRFLLTESDEKFNSVCYTDWGVFLSLNGFPDKAEQAYRKAIELDPEDSLIWISLGLLLHTHMNRFDEAEDAYRKAVEIDPKFTLAWYGLGCLLNFQNRFTEAEEACRRAIDLDPNYAKAWNGLGNLLKDQLDRPEEAETAYRKAIELDDDATVPRANLAYLLLSQPAKTVEAEAVYAEVIPNLPEYAKQLLTAYRAITRDNFGEAIENLNLALNENHPELYTVYHDDLLRLLRLARERGYGERLLSYLDETGLGERHWPLYAAFEAFLHGEEKLRDVNPEVRGAAKRILDWLSANLATTEQTQATAAKKGRRKKAS